MLLPSKSTRSSESIFCIASFVCNYIKDEEKTFDDVLDYLAAEYPKRVGVESLVLVFDFLYIIGKIEVSGDSFRIKL